MPFQIIFSCHTCIFKLLISSLAHYPAFSEQNDYGPFNLYTFLYIHILFFICIEDVNSSMMTSSTQKCHSWQLPCKNGQCIHYYDFCNGYYNCYDGSDEDYCSRSGLFIIYCSQVLYHFITLI